MRAGAGGLYVHQHSLEHETKQVRESDMHARKPFACRLNVTITTIANTNIIAMPITITTTITITIMNNIVCSTKILSKNKHHDVWANAFSTKMVWRPLTSSRGEERCAPH